MENVLIVAKTNTNDKKCVSGLVLCSNRSIRLLTALGAHQPSDTPFEIGQIWDLSWRRKYSPQPPHIEDVHVFEQKFIEMEYSLRETLLKRVHPWSGSPEQLFQKHLVLKDTSAYICRSAGLPTCSTGFWLPGKALLLSNTKNRPYYTLTYHTSPYSQALLRIPYVGCADPLPEIPAHALIRVSLARWWKKTEEEEKKCYLQLSGWYL